jgi:uncharacterized protein YkwD
MRFSVRNASAALSLAMLVACGGGGGSGGNSSQTMSSQSTPTAPQQPGAPQTTGSTATDGFNWFNFRRGQLGLAALTRNTAIDRAAQAHSDYQKLNNTITHDEIQGNAGFTGVHVDDRLNAAGYTLGSSDYAFGEVISESGTASGVSAAEDLITAIYHRFVIFEPMFKDAGAGSATISGGSTFFTVDFAVRGLNGGLGTGNYVVYPFSGQTGVPIDFFSDFEEPDPVANKNEVGYPISIHADIVSSISVATFTVKPHGGTNLSTQLLTQNTDANHETGPSEAALIPLDPLAHGTVYDVQFVGTVDSVPVSKTWSFTTQ